MNNTLRPNRQTNKYPHMIRPFVQQMVIDRAFNNTISLTEYEHMRLNSYERHYIVPYLSDEALIDYCLTVLKNCAPCLDAVPVVYDETAINTLMPELMYRVLNR